ncbi:MAG TPA: glycosyl transferase [Arenimonas sp.]|nr:MAG: glycosyl transferase [Xanthomonadales bacterium GWF1_69_6]HBD19876.1 glycosyl transferase [Arenimonas sp.]
MRRLTVVQLLPALHSGGVERSTLEIAAALVAAGHRSVVVSAGGRLVAALLAGGSEHIELPIGAKSLRAFATMRRLRAQLAALEPDIVHARSRLPAWLGWFALRGLPAPRPRFVTTVHGLNSPGRYSGILCRGERVVCVSDTVRAHVLRHWPGTDPAKLQVIPRGIDPAQFPRGHQPDAAWRARFAAEHPALQGGRLLLLPGRGTRLKGHADAIRLLAALRAGGEDARLWLLGAREPGREAYLAELEALASSLGVASALAISEPRSDVLDAYAVADLVLQVSNKPEAFGRTVLEALSVGRPVLGWAHGGVGELLGALYPAGAVPVGEHAALAVAARVLLAAPPPVPVTMPHTLAAMQSATLDLYARLVSV